MKQLKHPATIIATLALFVGLAGGAYAGGLIDGSQIKNHTIAAKKLTKAAVTEFTAQQPAATMATWSATATSSPTPTPLGTFLGDKLEAACVLSNTNSVESVIYLQTSDGSWNVQYAYDEPGGTVHTNTLTYAAGTFTAPVPIDSVTANAGGTTKESQATFLQATPSAGQLTWHQRATTSSSSSCRATIQAVPATLSAFNLAAPHASKPSALALKPGQSVLQRP